MAQMDADKGTICLHPRYLRFNCPLRDERNRWRRSRILSPPRGFGTFLTALPTVENGGLFSGVLAGLQTQTPRQDAPRSPSSRRAVIGLCHLDRSPVHFEHA